MKVKSLVKATKEFERLQSLIEKIEKNLEDFAKVNTVDNESDIVYVSGGFITFRSSVELLKAKLVELKREQDSLEL